MPLPTFLLPKAPAKISTSASSAVGGSSPPAGRLIAGFAMQAQLEDLWFWAAVSSSVADLYRTPGWLQCDIFNAEFASHGWDCCGADSADKSRCNKRWYLDKALRRVGHFDHMTASMTAFADLQAEIALDQPVGCRVAWATGGAHFVAITGWSIGADGVEYVDIADPYCGPAQLTYQGFCHAYQSPGDRWTHSYYTTDTPPSSALGGSVDLDSVTNA